MINLSHKNTIIWDYNGTLIDDVHICIESINKMLIDRNIRPIDEFSYKKLFDFPVKEYYAKIGFDFNKESFEYVGKLFVDIYNERSKSCFLHKGVVEVLKSFADAGKKQYVLSARQEQSLADELDFFGISHYFTDIYGLKDLYAYGKKDLGMKMMKDYQFDPETTVMIGDTCHDAEVARAMGIDIVLMSYGHHLKERLLSCSYVVFDDVNELYSTF